MEPMANMALRAARLAGQHIVRAFDRPDLIKISDKGNYDLVTNVDKEAERIIIDTLQKAYPRHGFMGEEHTSDSENESEYQWIIDPIDGTSNFSRNIPHFCVSIGCMHKGKLAHGVIVDPLRQEEFVASKGKGCQFNGKRVRVTNSETLGGAMLSTGGMEHGDVSDRQGQVYATLIAQHAIMRQSGSAALDLAYIAAGRLDGMWMRRLNLWDLAAGALMVTEAGGFIGDFNGGAEHLKTGSVVAASPKVFKALAPIVKTHLGGVA